MSDSNVKRSENKMDEMNGIFLEGIVSPYQLSVAKSKMPEAGFGLFVGKELPAGEEIFRATPVVSAVYRGFVSQLREPNGIGLATRMLLRLVLLHQKGQISSNQWKATSALESHTEFIGPSEKIDLSAINADISLVKHLTTCESSEKELQDLYWRINFNQHSVDSPLKPQLGSCLVLSAALVNHSCDPNAHHLSEGSELVVRSSRKIMKHEEITISYIDSTQSYDERQKALSTTYAFGCQCRKCLKGFDAEGEILTGNPDVDAPILNVRSKLYALLNSLVGGVKNLNGVETKMQEITHDLPAGMHWPTNTSPVPNLYGVLAKKLAAEQQWNKALQVWLKLVYIIDPLRYPDQLNAHRVEHLMALCQLEGYVPLPDTADKLVLGTLPLLQCNRATIETDLPVIFSQISQMCAIVPAIKAMFSPIEAALTVVLNYHNFQLKEDAAASLGTNHTIYKVAAHFVESLSKQLAPSMGVPYSVQQSNKVKDMMTTIYEARERELLEWAGIDLNLSTV